MKKLLLGTAIASLVANVAFAETKVGGVLETTFSMNSSKASSSATEDSNPAAIAHETEINISTSKDLDNGLAMSAGFAIVDGSQENQFLKLSSGAFTFAVGNDVSGVADNVSQEDFTPHIAQSFHDAVIGSGNIAGVKTVHGGNGLYGIYKTDMATIEAVYSPDTNVSATSGGSTNGSRAATATSTASGYDIAVKGNFGVEGLTAGYGISKATATLSSQADQEGKGYGVKYDVGAFSIGGGKTESNTAGSTTDFGATTYGVAYKASDALSVGIYTGKWKNDSYTKDEDYQSVQVGYDLGGMGITLGYYTVENVGGTEGVEGEKLEVRTVTKF